MKKKNIRQGAGCIVILAGITFILSSIGLILTIVTGGSLSNFFSDEEGESTFGWYKIQFWILVISVIALLMAEGKLSNLRFLNKFPYEEDNDDEGKIERD